MDWKTQELFGLTLLCYLLYCGGLELQYFRGVLQDTAWKCILTLLVTPVQ